MRYLELSGGPREIGIKHGAAFADDIKQRYAQYCVRRGKTPDKLKPSIRKYVEEKLPEIAEEIEGVAKGAGMTYEEIFAYNHFNVISGCTPVFFRHSELGPLLAQNLDCEPEELTDQLVRRIVPSRGQACLIVGRVGTVWASNWVNQAGIAKTGVSAHQQHYRTEDGTHGNIIQYAIAREAKTLDEAFNIISAHRHLGKAGISLFADAAGRAIHVEGDADRKWKTEISDDFAFSTGLYITGNVISRDKPETQRPGLARKETVEQVYREGKIEFTLDGMKKLLSYHAPDPGSVCRHNRSAGSATQSTRIWILRERKLLVTDGPPCAAKFQEFTLKD